MKNKRTEQGTIGMKFSYAGRFNSFVFKNATVYDAIDSYRKMNGIKRRSEGERTGRQMAGNGFQIG